MSDLHNTKEEILKTALKLFAQNGYEATSVSDIAEKIGISKGSLYKHYHNKRDIFESILKRMEQTDADKADANNVPSDELAQAGEKEYAQTSLEDVLGFSKEMFRYWCEDEFAANFRRMLTIEQYRCEEMMQLYQQYLGKGPIAYLADILSEQGWEKPQEKAVICYAPMFMLYSVYDEAQDKKAVLSLLDKCLDDIYQNLQKKEGF